MSSNSNKRGVYLPQKVAAKYPNVSGPEVIKLVWDKAIARERAPTPPIDAWLIKVGYLPTAEAHLALADWLSGKNEHIVVAYLTKKLGEPKKP